VSVFRRNGRFITENDMLSMWRDGVEPFNIAKQLGISNSTVIKVLHRHGLPKADSSVRPKVCLALDGHKCRSDHEKLVDNWLYLHNIRHVYEPRLRNIRFKPDWYLPKQKLYMEFVFLSAESGTRYQLLHQRKITSLQQLLGARFVVLNQNNWETELEKAVGKG